MKKKKQKPVELPVVYIQGNNDANYVKISQLDENRMRIEIGDCCVHTVDITVTAEVFSNFLTNVGYNDNKGTLNVMKEHLSWDKEYNEEIFKGCVSN